MKKRDTQAEKKITDFLLDHLGEKMYLSQIARSSGASLSTCHQILEKKVANKEIEKLKMGNLSIYFLDQNDPLISYTKIARAMELLKPLRDQLQAVSQKIILFGSAAQGEDTTESDFDLFILTNEKKAVQKIIRKSKLAQKIQPIVKNFLEFMELKKEDPVFYQEIKKGRVLWNENREE